ncbi:MAG TPA: zinc-regulated TonB-dependent outer membrane receptor [Kofleriaceae bacterium]|nr:zinc-regulated TonB-dependent outer membrane receptor [Kofleriaceae bacterium]
MPPHPPEEEPAAPAPSEPAPGAKTDELKDIESALAEDTAAKAAAAAPSGGTGVGAALASLNPDLSFILDVAAAWFSAHENLQTGGHDPTANGFNLQQLEMAVGKAVDPYFRFDANIVFLPDGVEIEEAYATTLALPYSLQVRAGQFLTRFGRLNPTHPHTWDFIDQPFAIGRVFGGDGNRGVGVEVSYLTPAPFYLELVGSATRAAGAETARSFLGPSEEPPESPLDVQTTLAAKEFFELSSDWSLATGQSLATGPNATGRDNRTDIYGADAYLKYRPITRGSHTIVALQTEWLLRRRQVPGRLLTDLSGYAYVMWRFEQRWSTGARYELGTPPRDAAGVAGDDLDPAWTRTRHRAAIDLTFFPTEFSRLRAQAGVDVPRWLETPIWSAFLAMEISVGAHGAHKF